MIRTVFLHVTKACNLRCSYCYFSARRPLPDELTTAELQALWPEVVAVRPTKLVFTGGEPLLRADILELLAGMRAADPEHAVLRCLNTNGHLVTPELATRLVGLADEVRVSVDALEARNDALRGEGNFAAALEALRVFRSAGFEPIVLVTVTRESLPDLEALIAELTGQGFRYINVNPFRPIGRGAEHPEWRVAQDEIRDVLVRCGVAPRAPASPPDPCHCGVGNYVNVMSNGDVYPCHVLTQEEFSCGNVRTHRLQDVCARSSGFAALSREATCLGEVIRRASTPGRAAR